MSTIRTAGLVNLRIPRLGITVGPVERRITNIVHSRTLVNAIASDEQRNGDAN